MSSSKGCRGIQRMSDSMIYAKYVTIILVYLVKVEAVTEFTELNGKAIQELTFKATRAWPNPIK